MVRNTPREPKPSQTPTHQIESLWNARGCRNATRVPATALNNMLFVCSTIAASFRPMSSARPKASCTSSKNSFGNPQAHPPAADGTASFEDDQWAALEACCMTSRRTDMLHTRREARVPPGRLGVPRGTPWYPGVTRDIQRDGVCREGDAGKVEGGGDMEGGDGRGGWRVHPIGGGSGDVGGVEKRGGWRAGLAFWNDPWQCSNTMGPAWAGSWKGKVAVGPHLSHQTT
jgi:hypothetical protein